MGTFDIPHIGHVLFLAKVMSVAVEPEEILVGINTDEFVATFKEPPIYSYDERKRAISALGLTTVPNDGPGIDLIKQYRPSTVVVGSDWLARDYLSQIGATESDMQRLGFNILFVPYSDTVSTTSIKDRLARRSGRHD